jgi:hypothetical protein
MSTLGVKVEALATDVSFTQDSLRVALADGREIIVPLEWFHRLRDASDDKRKDWRLIGGGIGIHWQKIDEDISVSTLLALS